MRRCRHSVGAFEELLATAVNGVPCFVGVCSVRSKKGLEISGNLNSLPGVVQEMNQFRID